LGLDFSKTGTEAFRNGQTDSLACIRLPRAEIQGDLLNHPESLDMVRVQMGKEEMIDSFDPGPVKLLDDLGGGIDQKVFVMYKCGWPRPAVRHPL
jgi:hypothetical protein